MCPMTKIKSSSSSSSSSSSYQPMQQRQRRRQRILLPLTITLLMLFISSLLFVTKIVAFQQTTTTISSVPNNMRRRIIMPFKKGTINSKHSYLINNNNNERIERTTILSNNCYYKKHTTKLYAVPVVTTAIAAATTSTTIPSILSSISNIRSIVHGDPIYCLMMIILISTAGIQLERKTLIGKALSAPLITMAIALLFANIGNIIPFESTIYTMITTYLIPLAVPMLLYDSNIQRIIKDTGISILAAFFIGSFATMIGTIIAYPLVPMISLSANSGWKVACALAARHIGGAINFIAVADTLNIPSTVVSAAIAADNVVVALYFTFLFAIAKPGEVENSNTITTTSSAIESSPTTTISTTTKFESEGDDDYTIASSSSNESTSTSTANANVESITLSSLGISLSVATILVFIGKYVTKFLLPTGTSSLPVTSLLTVLGATLFSKTFTSIRKSGTTLGILFIQMFFAASGASGSIQLVLQQAPTLFLFSILQISIHFIVLLGIGNYICKIPNRELYLSSNANIGGPTTAAAMAQAKNWTSLIIPSLLIGIVGYATATSIALIVLGPIIQRLPTIHTFVLPKLLLQVLSR